MITCGTNRDCNYRCCYKYNETDTCKKIKCTDEGDFEYKDCFFYLDTENIRYATIGEENI